MSFENPAAIENIIDTLIAEAAKQEDKFTKLHTLYFAYKSGLTNSGISDRYINWTEPLERKYADIEAEFSKIKKSTVSKDIENINKLIRSVSKIIQTFSSNLKMLEAAIDFEAVSEKEIVPSQKNVGEEPAQEEIEVTREVTPSYIETANKLKEEARQAFLAVQEMAEELENKGLLNEFWVRLVNTAFDHQQIQDNLNSIINNSGGQLSEEDIKANLAQVEGDLDLILDIGMKVYNRLGEVKATESEESVPETSETKKDSVSIENEKKYTPDKVAQLAQLYKDKNELAYLNNKGHYKGLTAIKIDITKVLRSLTINTGEAEAFMVDGVGELSTKIFGLEQSKNEAKGKKDKYKIQAKISGVYADLLNSVSDFINSATAKEKVTPKVENTEESDVDKQLSSAVLEAEQLLSEIEVYSTEVSEAQKSAKRTIGLINDLSEDDKNVLAQNQAKYLKGLLKNIAELREEVKLATGPIEEPEQKESLDIDLAELDSSAKKEKYSESKEKVRGSSKEYKEKKKAYEEALAAHYEEYQNNSAWKAKIGRGVDGVKKLFGTNPELPPALQAMQNEYKEIRSLYAKSLDEIIEQRSQREINNGYTFDADNLKMAFGRKFILRPNKDLLQIQEKALTPEEMGRVRKALALLGKHRWLARVGSVAIGTAIGMGTGGVGLVAAGAFSAARVVGSAGAAAAAGIFTNFAMQKRVNTANEKLTSAKTSALENFSLEDLDKLESDLLAAQNIKDVYERQQKVATIAAAVIAGGATGIGVGAYAASEAAANAAGDSGSLSAETIARLNETAAEVPAPDMAEALPVNNPTGMYEVQKGDTLWDIVKEKNAGILNKLPIEKQNEILDALFDKVRANPNLTQSLGLKSGNDIDLIYANEKLNLTSLNEELSKIVENQKDLGTYIKSSGLNVAPDDVARKVPISVVESQVPGGTAITVVGGKTYTEAVPPQFGYSETPVPGATAIEVPSGNVYTEAVPETEIISQSEILKAPTTLSPTGMPFELREYQNYLTQKYGDMDEFSREVNKEALNIESTAYGAFEKNAWFGTDYESPYTMLSNMTIADMEELMNSPVDEIKNKLAKSGENGMKYEAYLVWTDKFKDIMAQQKTLNLQIGPKTMTTFGSLFEQYFDKTTVLKVNPLTSSNIN